MACASSRWVAATARYSTRRISTSPNSLSTHVRLASPSARPLHSSSHTTSRPDTLSLHNAGSTPPQARAAEPTRSKASPLAILPLSTVLRSLMTATVSSSPYLLAPSLAVMSALAHASNPLLNPDRNKVLRFLLKKTFYAQFCAGENAHEVRRTVASLKDLGFTGVILGYAKEDVPTDGQAQGAAAEEEAARSEIHQWAMGNVETVRLAAPGDFVALKLTGAGRQARHALSHRLPPSPALAQALDAVVQLAAQRGVRLLVDAEHHALQAGVDDWTLDAMRRYNARDRATVFATYQAYLKAAPATLSAHLAAAAHHGFALGVKLVRGAYLASDPRHLMHDTKADTDACYDGIAAALLRRQWAAPLCRQPDAAGHAPFPLVHLVLASHNSHSVRKARAMVDAGARGTPVAFAQLQGMADEISCELVLAAQAAKAKAGRALPEPESSSAAAHVPSVYKYLCWGSTGECLQYLLRRAHENKDAVQRTKSERDAMRAELVRRMKSWWGLA